MGKGSDYKIDPEYQSEKNDNNSIRYYTRDEVHKHNKKNDCWIIINENIYNLTNFQNKHPGGSRIINIHSGQDASEVFNAFHKEFDKVNKYSKLYLIGKVYPNETSSLMVADSQANINFQKEKELRNDFKELRKIAFDKGYFAPSYLFFALHALHIFFFHFMGYYLLWNYGATLIPLVLAIMCHTISQAQSDWAQHDYGHSSLLAKPKYNRYLQMIFLGLIKGASADWWNYMHNQHHAKPNVVIKLKPN